MLRFADPNPDARPLYFMDIEEYWPWHKSASEIAQQWLAVSGFRPVPGACIFWPDGQGDVAGAVVIADDARGRFALGAARAKLPNVTWRLATTLPQGLVETQLLGWLLAGYQFDRYKKKNVNSAYLICPDGINRVRLESIAQAEAMTRDLINTPTQDMGPAALEKVTRDLASSFGAEIEVTKGEDLLAKKFPLIHAVGRAAEQAPRLIDFQWGTTGPVLTLVGKGVCFDTGGLNLKPGSSMGLMKKDMGGAAMVLGLAQMIMTLDLPLRLRVLIPAVENSVSGNSFRPGDILRARNGLSVEVNNTDAEGRLVLADALSLAVEEYSPALLVSMATLTGAARVALGPDLVPYFTDDDALAQCLDRSAARVADPVWRLPFWTPYESMIEPKIADLDNAPKGGMAGAITAALFLRRFVAGARYAHFDAYGWQPTAAPARPIGGVGQATRALLESLPEALNL